VSAVRAQAATAPGAGGVTVARNVVWNLLGQGTPLVAAVVCIPFLARGLGSERLGLLALCWSVIGYFGIFDLGLGQAMTRSVAQKLAAEEHGTISQTVWTTLAAMFALGAIAMGAALLAAPFVAGAIHVSAALQPQAMTTFRLLALSIPLVIVSVGLRGVLEAHQSFRTVSAIRTPLGIWTYAGPLLVLAFSRDLRVIVLALLCGRVAGLVLYAFSALRTSPRLRRVAFHWPSVGPLLRFGGWLTLDNLMDPIGGVLDRFLIGSLVSVAAVAYFSVAYQVATAAWVLPVALSGVLFPAFTARLVRDPDSARRLFARALRYLLLVMAPLTVAVIALAGPGLRLWAGGDIAAHATAVLQILAVGTLVTSLGSVADTFIQSAGRADLSAKLGVAKVLLYVGLAWPVIGTYGIVGAAALWVATTALEALGMFAVVMRLQHARVRDFALTLVRSS